MIKKIIQVIKQKTNKEIFIIILLLILLSPLYFFNLSSIPTSIHGDEAETALQALEIIKNNTGLIGIGSSMLMPLLSFIPHAIFIVLFGENIFSDRLAAVFFGVLTLPILYFLIKDLFNKRLALITTILLGTSHLWIALSRIGLQNTQATFFIVLELLILMKALRSGKKLDFLLSGGVFGLSMYSYVGVRILIFMVIALYINYFYKRVQIKQKLLNLILFLFSAALVFLPQAIFYLNNNSSLLIRENDVFVFSKIAKEWANYTKMNNVQILFEQTKHTFNIFRGDNSTQYGYKGQLLNYFSIIFFLIGICYGISKIKYFKYQFLFFWLFLAILGQILFTMPPPIFLPRFAVGLPIMYFFIAIGIFKISENIAKLTKNLKYFYLVIVLFIAYSISWNFYVYFIDYPKQIAGDPNARTTTKIGYYLNSLNNDYVAYFDTMPTIWADYRLIRFISPTGYKIDIADSNLNNLIKNQNKINDIRALSKIKDVAFIIYPEYGNSLKILKNIFPDGHILTFKEINNSIQFYVFRLK